MVSSSFFIRLNLFHKCSSNNNSNLNRWLTRDNQILPQLLTKTSKRTLLPHLRLASTPEITNLHYPLRFAFKLIPTWNIQFNKFHIIRYNYNSNSFLQIGAMINFILWGHSEEETNYFLYHCKLYRVNMSLVVYLCLFPNSVSVVLQHKKKCVSQPPKGERERFKMLSTSILSVCCLSQFFSSAWT